MNHIISTGRDGRLDGQDPEDVKALVAKALEGDCVVLHFHGGLVDKAGGEAVAAMLTPVYQRAGAYPIFFVWQSGAVEIIKHNILEIAREELFERLLRRVLSWSVGKVRDVAGGRPGQSTSLPPEQEVRDQLAARKRKTEPETGEEPFRADEPQPGAELTEEDEQRFLTDVEQDLDLRDALYGAMADRNLEATGSDGGRGVPDAAPVRSRMDDAVLEEIAEGDFEGARGLVSTLALAKRALKVLRAVLRRYDLGTAHGVYPTVVEELLRAFYLADLGGVEWQAMKKETADTFAAEGDRGGRLVLDALAAGLPADGSKKITLVGHSTGAVFIDHLLAEVLRRDAAQDHALPPDQRFQVIFLAPAATTVHFVDALGKQPDWLGRARIARFRMFTMKDEKERADRLVGAVYPRSLLYLVSGLLERDAQAKSAWSPVVGLARYLDGDVDELLASEQGRAARLADLRDYLDDEGHVVRSPTEDAEIGFRAGATSHGGFDNDRLVQESMAEMIRSWCDDQAPDDQARDDQARDDQAP